MTDDNKPNIFDYEDLKDHLYDRYMTDSLRGYLTEDQIKIELTHKTIPAAFFNKSYVKSQMEYAWYNSRNEILTTCLNSVFSYIHNLNGRIRVNGIFQYNSMSYEAFVKSYTGATSSIATICENIVKNPKKSLISSYSIKDLDYSFFLPEMFAFGDNADNHMPGVIDNGILSSDDDIINIADDSLLYENPYYFFFILQDIFTSKTTIFFNESSLVFLEDDEVYKPIDTIDIKLYEDRVREHVIKTDNYFPKDIATRIRQYTLAFIAFEKFLKNILFDTYKADYFYSLLQVISVNNKTVLDNIKKENKQLMQNSNSAFGWT